MNISYGVCIFTTYIWMYLIFYKSRKTVVTARAQLVSGNLFLKNSNCCPAEKSVLGELDWFSGGNFPSEIFPLEKFLTRKVSGISAFRRKFPWRKFSRIPVSGSSFPGILISAGKNSGGKLDALVPEELIQLFKRKYWFNLEWFNAIRWF